MSLTRKAFKRSHYPVDIIAQGVRWYLAYALNLHHLEEMMEVRGISVYHFTIHRWVILLVLLLDISQACQTIFFSCLWCSYRNQK
jgi:transposase-like protein